MKSAYSAKGKMIICIVFALSSVTYYSLGTEPDQLNLQKDVEQSIPASDNVQRKGFFGQLTEQFKVSETALFDPSYWARNFYNIKDFQRL